MICFFWTDLNVENSASTLESELPQILNARHLGFIRDEADTNKQKPGVIYVLLS